MLFKLWLCTKNKFVGRYTYMYVPRTSILIYLGDIAALLQSYVDSVKVKDQTR